MKRKSRKLVLSKETLVQLGEAGNLRDVAGGITGTCLISICLPGTGSFCSCGATKCYTCHNFTC